VWSGPAGLWLAAALRPRGHNKCAALWAAAAAAGTAGAEAARMMSRRSRGRNSTHDVLNYSNPGKESWSGHGAFRGARRRRRGSRLRRPLTRRGAAYKYWRTLGRRKKDRCGNLRALWGGLIDVLVCTIAGTGSQPVQVLDPFLNNQGAHGHSWGRFGLR